MANLGDYQVGDELYRTAFASVCTAKRLDEAEASTKRNKDFVVKIFDPATTGTADDDPAQSKANAQRAAAFLQGVKAQQQVAAAGKFWAPIHESGNGAGKPFYITNYYARTAQKLLSGRVILNPFGLHEIMQSVVMGLVELKAACGRAHGNLKPTNVLIGGQGRVAEGKVVLSDPAPGPCEGKDEEAEDLRAVGEILYQLVMHRPAHATTWPVGESEEWARLGRRGRDWRQLCSDLLSYDKAERKTLEDLQRTVRKLLPIKVPVGKIAAAVVGFGVIVGGAGWSASRWEQSARAEVAAAQDQWFSVLQDPSRVGVLDAEPYLHDVLSNDRSHDDVIQAALAADGWMALKPSVIRQVMEARAIARESHRKWLEALKKDAAELSDKLAVYKNRQWNIPARNAQLPALNDNPSAQAIVEGATQVRDVRARIAVNDPSKRWMEFEKKLGELKGVDDGYFAKFAELLRIKAAGAITLSDQSWIATANLQRSDALAAKLIAKEKVDFDRDRFSAEERGSINLADPALADIERFVATVDLYARVADAGQKAAYDCRTEFVEQIASGVAQHTDQWPAYRSPEFIAERSKIEDDCVALGKRTFLVKDLRLNEENRGPLFDKRAEIKQQIALLRSKYYKPPADPAQFVASLAELNVKDARLKAIWERNTRELASKKRGEIPAPQFEERKKQIQSLQKLLKTLDNFTPAPALTDPYQAIAVARRSEDFDPLLKRLGDGGSLAIAQFQALADDTARANANYAQWSNKVKDLARDFEVLPGSNQIIEVASFPDQGWRDAGDAPTRDFWRAQVLAPNGPFNPVLKPLLDRLDKLREVQDDDLRAVTALATKTKPASPAEILVAAWRRIASEGQLARPASIASLGDEGVIRANLASIDPRQLAATFRSTRSGDKAASSLGEDLQREFARGPYRWCEAVRSASSPSDIHAAMGVSGQFNLNFTIDEKAVVQESKVAIVSAPALTAHAGDLGPAAYYNVALALTQDAITANSAVIAPSRLDTLMRAADQLPQQSKSDFALLVRWLQTARVTYSESLRTQAAALLGDSMFLFPPAQPPSVLGQALAAAGRLKEKQPQQGLALLKGIVPPERNAFSDGTRVQIARLFLDLGNSVAPDINAQKDAFTQSMRLGNKDAMVAMMQIDKPMLAKELKDLADAGNVDAQVMLAKMYEFGWGVQPSLSDARRLYTLADYRQNAEAHEWLRTHPVAAPPITPLYSSGEIANNPPPVVVTPPPRVDPPPTVVTPPEPPVTPKRRPRAGN